MVRLLRSSGAIPLLILGLVLIPLGIVLLDVTPVAAQCGASASSCKNCHEVNAKYPVNTSGEWHTSHAFGDFCAFCHAGNVQAVEEAAAHEGMIYPLSDPQGSCQSCHPANFMEEAQIYATALGATIGAADTGQPTSGQNAAAVNPADIECKPIAPPGEKFATGPLTDFNRRYDIEVLGHTDTSTLGNTILWVMAGLLLIGGFFLVWRLEKLDDVWRKARIIPGDDWRRLAYSGAYDIRGPVIPTRSASSAGTAAPVRAQVDLPAARKAEDLAPVGLEKLDNATRNALAALMADPKHGSAILQAVARLDPTLINSLQSLDRKDRDLLLAVVEQLTSNQ